MKDIDIIKKAVSKKHPCDEVHSAIARLNKLVQERDELKAHVSDLEDCFFILPEKIRASAVEELREDAYQKKAYLMIDFGIDGSACKRISNWLDHKANKLRSEA